MVAPPISSEAKMWPVGVTSSHVRGIVLSGGLEGLSVVEAVRDEASQELFGAPSFTAWLSSSFIGEQWFTTGFAKFHRGQLTQMI
jgi:hypothetical protein